MSDRQEIKQLLRLGELDSADVKTSITHRPKCWWVGHKWGAKPNGNPLMCHRCGVTNE